ncbi:ABC transporter ATP-binding protein [Jiangella rhizosphaerae]|nr:ABC transporter ATP-binding protein [Jiangella rhizosphaerae]
MQSPLLSVDDLHVAAGGVDVVHGVSFDLAPGEAIGLVGESGSGKTLTCRAILGVPPPGVTVSGGAIRLAGEDVSRYSRRQWDRVRGPRVAAVFQDPASYLNPSLTVGRQLDEVLRVKNGLDRRAARTRAVELLASMGLHRPEHVHDQYPYELSGGMLQRVLIAIAVSGDPDLLVADEPTTALDVTVQAEVLDLIAALRAERRLSLLLVSHDLAVVAQLCDRVVVLRHGRVVESGPTRRVLDDPADPYTRQLVADHREYGLDRLVTR